MARSSFTTAKGNKICEEIAAGKSLRKVCKSQDMPNMSTVLRWIADDPVFCEQYTRAREAQADHFVDEIIDIADKSDLNADDKRIRIDARKWVAGKQRPKKYGDKQQVEHTGKDGAETIKFTVNIGELHDKDN